MLLSIHQYICFNRLFALMTSMVRRSSLASGGHRWPSVVILLIISGLVASLWPFCRWTVRFWAQTRPFFRFWAWRPPFRCGAWKRPLSCSHRPNQSIDQNSGHSFSFPDVEWKQLSIAGQSGQPSRPHRPNSDLKLTAFESRSYWWALFGRLSAPETFGGRLAERSPTNSIAEFCLALSHQHWDQLNILLPPMKTSFGAPHNCWALKKGRRSCILRPFLCFALLCVSPMRQSIPL